MRFNINREWLAKYADEEDCVEVTAGRLGLNDLEAQTSERRALLAQEPEVSQAVPIFGRFINMCRRKRGLTLERLAEKARIDVSELLKIEMDIRYRPEPRTVYQLSRVLGVSTDRLMQLSGNTKVRDTMLEISAVKFAAHSESLEKLSPEEARAFEDFVKALSEP
jgi:HTH-type transcriptional regulator, competence development regulator